MPIDLEDEGRSTGHIRGKFDHEREAGMPALDDLEARAMIALTELVRSLRRTEDRTAAMNGRHAWTAAFTAGYQEGRLSAQQAPAMARPVKASQLVPARKGYVCPWCRSAVGAELGGFELDHDAVVRTLGDELLLDNLARELGADIPGHRCEARDGLGTCACGCAIWR